MEQPKEPEVWKPVPDYEGLYEVSNYGRVKRLEHLRKHYIKGVSLFKEKILTQSINSDGYVNYKLYKNKIKKSFKAHRLVALIFIENIKKCKEVNHIDGDKLNNCFTNLEWVSKRENQSHRYLKTDRSSNFIGVSYRGDLNKPYIASIGINSKTKYIGQFYTEKEAHQAYLNALKEYGLKNKYAKP